LRPFEKSGSSIFLLDSKGFLMKDQSLTISLLCRKSWKCQQEGQKQSRYLSEVKIGGFSDDWAGVGLIPETTTGFILEHMKFGQDAWGGRPEVSYDCSMTESLLVSFHGPVSYRRLLSRACDVDQVELLCRRSRTAGR
jgi:hypothetical protein